MPGQLGAGRAGSTPASVGDWQGDSVTLADTALVQFQCRHNSKCPLSRL
jgi:hypothetical protein